MVMRSEHLTGLALVGLIAVISMAAANEPWLQSKGLSALTIAIVLGVAVGNTVYPSLVSRAAAGVSYAKGRLLRAGIIFFGLRLTIQDVFQVGASGVLIDCLTLASTFFLAWWMGTRVLRLDRETAWLIGAGSAICGAAAVLATEPVIEARSEKVSVAVATVVIFGTLAMFLYPGLYVLSQHALLPRMDPREFGIYIGSTVHEVAQVVAAAHAVSEHSADAAVITKMVRVMMLAPFLMLLSAWRGTRVDAADQTPATSRKPAITVPWFALGFLAVVVLNSVVAFGSTVKQIGLQVDTFLLVMAMGALGLTTSWRTVREAGMRPIQLAAALFLWLVVGGNAINVCVTFLEAHTTALFGSHLFTAV
jgi:uncharacterized integral membrane protein (TIGR00698 family)